MTKRKLTKRELAERRGVSTRRIDQWMRQGCPHEKTKTGVCLFEENDVARWYNATIKSPAPSDPDFQKARARKEEALASKHETQLAVLRGTLIDKAKTEREIFTCARMTRDAFLSLPDRLAGVLAAEHDQHKVHELMRVEIKRILTDLARRVEELNDPQSRQ